LADGLKPGLKIHREENEMDDTRLGKLYQQMAETVIEMIPEEWEKVYLYGEVADGFSKSFFFYYPSERREPVYSLDIPELFHVSEEKFAELKHQLLDELEELWTEYQSQGHEPWTNLTFILDNSGKFKIDFDYTDLSGANPHQQQIIWEYQYLRLVPEDEDDRAFL
jgi:uncharacterized protein (TIGR01741 family)